MENLSEELSRGFAYSALGRSPLLPPLPHQPIFAFAERYLLFDFVRLALHRAGMVGPAGLAGVDGGAPIWSLLF